MNIILSKYDSGQISKTHSRPMYSLIPVSYTHLDVYKRQLQYCSVPPGLKCLESFLVTFSNRPRLPPV